MRGRFRASTIDDLQLSFDPLEKFLLGSVALRLAGGLVALKVDTPNQSGQLSGEVHHLVDRKAVTQGEEDTSEGVIGTLLVSMAHVFGNVFEPGTGDVDRTSESSRNILGREILVGHGEIAIFCQRMGMKCFSIRMSQRTKKNPDGFLGLV